MRRVYEWFAGSLTPIGSVSDAHLRAWEYEPASQDSCSTDGEQVRLWRTRRPDLAPPELWVGELDSAPPRRSRNLDI